MNEDELRRRADFELREERGLLARESRTDVEDVTDMAARVDAMGEVRFLVDRIWPADAYGVFAATDKAGKTWMAVDLAVSVALGDPWLAHYACQQGTVLMYCGEGGARNIIRRVRAVADSKDRPFSLLHGHLFVAESVPDIGREDGLAQIRDGLLNHGPVLITSW